MTFSTPVFNQSACAIYSNTIEKKNLKIKIASGHNIPVGSKAYIRISSSPYKFVSVWLAVGSTAKSQ